MKKCAIFCFWNSFNSLHMSIHLYLFFLKQGHLTIHDQKKNFIVHTNHCFFIHLFVDGHLPQLVPWHSYWEHSCNKYTSVWDIDLKSFGYNPGVVINRLYGRSFHSFLRNVHIDLHSCWNTLHSQQQYRRFLSVHISASICYHLFTFRFYFKWLFRILQHLPK